MSGLTFMTGNPDGEPMHNGYPIGDAIGGLFGAVSVLTALLGIARGNITGGEEIDLSLTEATFRLLDTQTIQLDQLGTGPRRVGNESHYSAPANVFRTKDGHYVSLSGSTQATFGGNARAIDRPDLLDDQRFATNADRFAHRDELNSIFKKWFEQTELSEVLQAFEREQGTLAPIYSVEQIMEDPQFRAREAIVSVPDNDFDQVRMQNVTPKFSKHPGSVRHAAGAVGQDNDSFYRSELGLSASVIAEYRAKDII